MKPIANMYPFDFEEKEDVKVYTFRAATNVLYSATFKTSGYIFPKEPPEVQENVFEFSIIVTEKPEGKLPQPDNNIPATVASIFHHFFINRSRAVVYICESADLRASARMRKFNQWFEWYRGNEFAQFSLPIEQDSDGQKYYTAMILHTQNPNSAPLIEAYLKLVRTFSK